MLTGENEGAEIRRQAQVIYERLQHRKGLVNVPDKLGGGAHCITNNLPLMNEIVFHWLSKEITVFNNR
jgi:hypothetical protein